MVLPIASTATAAAIGNQRRRRTGVAPAGGGPARPPGVRAAGGPGRVGGAGSVAAGGPVGGDGWPPAGIARRKPVIAAPNAIECLGWASTATGTPSICPMSRPTSGIRDDPPTSRTAVSCSGRTPADRNPRSSASMLTRTDGSIIASNCDRLSRTSPS